MSALSTLDKDILATLDPTELAAIEGDKPDPADAAALRAVAAGAADDDNDDDDDAEGKVLDADGKVIADPAAAAAADAAAAAAAAASKPAAEATPPAAKTEAAPAPRAEAAPTYHAELPADYQTRVDALKTGRDELVAKFKAGDIDIDEYNTELDKINDERDALNSLRVKHEISQESAQQAAEREWSNAVNGLFDAAKAQGVDYRADAARGKQLDVVLKALAADDANADKSMQWFLDEAHKTVLAMMGKAAPAPAAAAPTPAPAAAAAKPAARTPPLEAAPKTLAQVPGSDGPGDLAGEFANIDALAGDDLEDAIARMTPAQRERYQRGL